MMDFFVDVQGVEVVPVGNNTGNVDLIRLKEIVQRREEERRISDENRVAPGLTEGEDKQTCKNLSSAQ